MPVFSTQGGLAFEKVPFAGQGWYANSVGDYNFNDFILTDSGANIHLTTGDYVAVPGRVAFGYARIDNSGSLPNVSLSRTVGSLQVLGLPQDSEGFAISLGGNISAPSIVTGGYLYGNTPVPPNTFLYNKFIVNQSLPLSAYRSIPSGAPANVYNTITSIESIGNNNSYIMGLNGLDLGNSNLAYNVFFAQVNTANGATVTQRSLASFDGSYQGSLSKTVPGDIALDTNGNVILTYNNQLSFTDPSLNGKVSTIGKLYANLVNQWGITMYNNTFTTNVNDVTSDNNNNICAVVSTDSAYNSYVIKTDTTGNIQYNQNFSNVNLTCVTTDQDNNIYIAGNDNSNRIYVAELDNTGNIVWQNFLTDSASTYSVKKLAISGSSLYLCGDESNKGFLVKVPLNGSRPGNGVYGSITYGISNVTNSVATDLYATYQPGYFAYPAAAGGSLFPFTNANVGQTSSNTLSITTTTIT